jgi:hypothetical protein
MVPKRLWEPQATLQVPIRLATVFQQNQELEKCTRADTSHLSLLTSLHLPSQPSRPPGARPFRPGAPQGQPRLFDDFRGAKDDKGHDEHGARDDLLFLRRHAGEAQAVLNEGKHQERYENAAHRAGSSKDVYAPQDNSGYHRKF